MELSGLSRKDVSIIKEENKYSGFCDIYSYKIKHKMFAGGTTDALFREVVVRPKSVGVVLYDPKKDVIVMIEQFRIGAFLNNAHPWLLEIIAGYVEQEETIKTAAIREVKEEANYLPENFIHITDVLLSPGSSTEKIHLYCAIINAYHTNEYFGVAEEHEDIKTHVMPFNKAYSMIEDGSINNAPAIIAIQWLKLNRRKLFDYENS